MTIQNPFPASQNVPEQAADGLSRKVLARNDNLRIVDVPFDAATTAPLHHPEQTTCMMSGCSLCKQPNIEHGATCLEAGTLLDDFTSQGADFAIMSNVKSRTSKTPSWQNP